MNEPNHFDIERLKEEYFQARITPRNQVPDVEAFLEALANFRANLVMEIGLTEVLVIDAKAATAVRKQEYEGLWG